MSGLKAVGIALVGLVVLNHLLEGFMWNTVFTHAIKPLFGGG